MFFPTEAKSDFFLQKEKWESLCESFFCFGQKNIVLKILFGFLWSFSVSMFWKRKKFTVPIQLPPHNDTSAYPLHTWIVLLNLTVYFEAIEGNCSTQSVYFLRELLETVRLIFFCAFVKEICGFHFSQRLCGHDNKNNRGVCLEWNAFKLWIMNVGKTKYRYIATNFV